jgi:flagellin-like protein
LRIERLHVIFILVSYLLNIEASKLLSTGEVEMRKISKSKKGISPISATLLLIVIAVVAVAVTYAWVMTFTGSTTGQAAVLTVENVRFHDFQYIEVTLRNSGNSDAKVESVYVGTSASNLARQGGSYVEYKPDTQIVVAGSTLNITITYSWTDGIIYHFNIATEEGLNVPFQREA